MCGGGIGGGALILFSICSQWQRASVCGLVNHGAAEVRSLLALLCSTPRWKTTHEDQA